uniref:Uncharacterized protein n=1 Tax=Pseudo-nitzschia australis TaxID=44445 RepID=A0A7S4AQH6_9STRA
MGIKNRYEQFALVNDSIFALKQYHNITDALGTINKFHNNRIIDNNNNNNNNTITTANKDGTSTTTGTSTSAANTTVSMTSLNFHENDDASFPWQESIFRAFDPYGLRVFMDHSCVPMEHESFCHGKAAVKKKRCIVDFHEIQVAYRFPNRERQAFGIFPGTVPNDFQERTRTKGRTVWVCNVPFWKEVLLPAGFPAAKVNCPPMYNDNIDDPLLDTCTRFLNRSMIDTLDFSKADRTINYFLKR